MKSIYIIIIALLNLFILSCTVKNKEIEKPIFDLNLINLDSLKNIIIVRQNGIKYISLRICTDEFPEGGSVLFIGYPNQNGELFYKSNSNNKMALESPYTDSILRLHGTSSNQLKYIYSFMNKYNIKNITNYCLNNNNVYTIVTDSTTFFYIKDTSQTSLNFEKLIRVKKNWWKRNN
mgnify:CR=1 FL=1